MRYNAPVIPVEERCAAHQRDVESLNREHAREEGTANRISLFRLATFLAAVICASAAISQGHRALLLLSLALGLGFLVGVVAHAKTLARMNALAVRRAVHERHILRMQGTWQELRLPKAGLPPDHPYASDIDLTGAGSLTQRIDTSQTVLGERALLSALAQPAEPQVIRARQEAVRELAQLRDFRVELETLGSLKQERGEKLDHAPFMKLFERPLLFAQKPWLWPLTLGSVTVTLAVLVLSQLGVIPSAFVWLCVLFQTLLLRAVREPVHTTLNLVTARIGFGEAYEAMFRAIERQSFDSPCLKELQAQLMVQGKPASQQLARLARYEAFAQLRTQGPLYIVLNVLTLWDLFCLQRIESFVRDVGARCEPWFQAIGQLEMLCSLATLVHVEQGTSFPEIATGPAHLQASGLAHPLLPHDVRVANDVEINGPGSVLIITGSNMAGKSTLLRAVGLNVALALAGGAVCAERFSLPLVRLRASMRIDDSLQRGASYFHAELSRLRMVVGELGHSAPVLFLLDELLRGTNARARHQGARAVLLHLLRHGSLGIVATHDIALSELEDELPGKAVNVHFTDVFEDGEMRFDYKLQPGVVKTSNALRLLSMAGIEVEVDDALA